MAADAAVIRSTSESIPAGGVHLSGDLVVPARPTGLVLFAHGSGSGRHSPRNRQVASLLQQQGLATLLVDLLTAAEERSDVLTAQYRFDIRLLALRLGAIVDWRATRDDVGRLPVGLFGASTGAAAALITAAQHRRDIAAVVSRGGRPDLAGPWLERVDAPTRLIVGSLDEQVIRLNREAMTRMPGLVDLQIVDGATHLFEEPGTLDRAAHLAGDWYLRHLRSSAVPPAE